MSYLSVGGGRRKLEGRRKKEQEKEKESILTDNFGD